MDVQMPSVDGFETTAIIRSQEKVTRNHVPIITLTAHAMEGGRDRCLAAGMDAYLTKPLDSAQLFEILQNCRGGLLTRDVETRPRQIVSVQESCLPLRF
jgi:two-component system sensor histidine kinase/response regulator